MIETKSNQFEVNDQKKKEFNAIYDNCLHLISKRVYLLKVLENFLDDSQIVGAVIRIFRKLIQILTTESNSLIDKSKEPKVFAKEFRVFLIFII